MSQPSVASYFNNRKRAAVEDLKIASVRKVLLIEDSDALVRLSNTKGCNEKNSELKPGEQNEAIVNDSPKIVTIRQCKTATMARKTTMKQKTKARIAKGVPNQRNIEEVLCNMSKKESASRDQTDLEKIHRTPPSSPTKRINAMDKVVLNGCEPSLMELKKSLTRSSRLAELKASMARFKESQRKLEEAEKRTEKIATSPSLKTFKTIELEVTSPSKVCSPEKSYLSPKKDLSVRKNLLNLLSPTKTLCESPKKVQRDPTEKSSLTLPFKYRRLAEILRSIDTVSQIMYNRKEVITFRKLKPAVEEMLKRNLHEKHLSQIKNLCPDLFHFHQAKMKVYGAGGRQVQWELVTTPNFEGDTMTADVLLTRRRTFFNVLIDKVKLYHKEFLLTMDPPLHISMDEVKRWHPEFDIEKVPDIECAELPQPPTEDKFTTGKEVLERAKIMFNCNTRMEEALERLHQARKTNLETVEQKPPSEVTSVLKGIPKALLEKVRERQAAKALESMTRSAAKEKEVQLYSRLPEIARLTRNLFVAEKRSVLHIDAVVDKLSNSFRTFMTKPDVENHLRVISKEVPTWLVFHEIRHSTFVKIAKNADLNLVLNKLETLAKEKDNS